MISIGDYDKIMSDRNIFNQIVYTPLSEALRLLDERRKDPEFMAKVENILKGDIPEFLKENKCGILGRHIATPNHESRRFISIAKEHNLRPVFFEYLDDKFTSGNSFKHSLGQLHVQKEHPRHSHQHSEKITIIDFNIHNGKKLREVKTLWSESLVDFHKKLFTAHNYHADDLYVYDGSDWFKNNGGHKAVNFYSNFLSLFTCYGILFENFLTSKDTEGNFTKDIVLPAIEKVMNITGVKPLIVPLEPLEMEADDFWLHYLPKVRELIPTQKHD